MIRESDFGKFVKACYKTACSPERKQKFFTDPYFLEGLFFWLDLLVLCGVESFVKQYFQLFCPSFSLLSLFSLLTKLTIKRNFEILVVNADPV